MTTKNIIEDVAILLRGFFATPMMSSLGRLGVLKVMREKDTFGLNDFKNIPNKKLLLDTCNYFQRLGLLESADEEACLFRTNDFGKEIFRRANSFYVPHSYFEYMYRYHDLIQDGKGEVACSVERLENVIGSGSTHLRYFPPVISFLKRKAEFDLLVDLGCGDGQFLSSFVKKVPGKKVMGIDLSDVSTRTTEKNLIEKFPGADVSTFCSNALDVDHWAEQVRIKSGDGKVAISMWFLLHEISSNSPDIIVQFFNKIYENFPTAPLTVGELVDQGSKVLSENCHASLMPEYLFFHDMSGQGILSWDQYKDLLENIPYHLQVERVFDELPGTIGERIPSTFIWCLVPK